jgi:aminoglycoside 6'-N-acetyltransferase
MLRPAREDDVGALVALLAEPEVARWFGPRPYDAVRVREEMLDGFVIEVDGQVRGWVGYEEEDDPDYRHVALDIALSTELHGRGLGSGALREAIAHFAARGHHRFTIDPAADNERAIRCYRAVGFEPVGIMRAYERGADGTWHDGLLMDLCLVAAREQPV